MLNVQNRDDKCFAWAVLSGLYPVDKDSDRTTKYDQSQLNMDCVKFPVNPTNFNVKAKGIKKLLVKKQIHHQDGQESLTMHQVFVQEQGNIISKNQMTYSVKQKKTSLASFDDKRYPLEDGIRTLPHGHYLLKQ
eukprot:gene12445-biopygen9919